MNNPSVLAKLVLGFLLVVVPAVSIMGGVNYYVFRYLTLVNRQLLETNSSLVAMQGLETAVARALMSLNEAVNSAPGQDHHFRILMSEVDSRLKSCTDACHGAARRPREAAKSLLPFVARIKDLASAIFSAEEFLMREEKASLVHDANQQGEVANQLLKRMYLPVLLRTESLQRNFHEADQQARTLIPASMFLIAGIAILIAYVTSRRLWR